MAIIFGIPILIGLIYIIFKLVKIIRQIIKTNKCGDIRNRNRLIFQAVIIVASVVLFLCLIKYFAIAAIVILVCSIMTSTRNVVIYY